MFCVVSECPTCYIVTVTRLSILPLCDYRYAQRCSVGVCPDARNVRMGREGRRRSAGVGGLVLVLVGSDEVAGLECGSGDYVEKIVGVGDGSLGGGI